MINYLKSIIKKIFKNFGYDIQKWKPVIKSDKTIRKLIQQFDFKPTSQNRPIGDLNTFLNDIKARGFNCNIVLDIGSNIGEWSMSVKKIFPQAIFYLIDPIIEMKEYLEEFCRKQPGSKYFLVGIGSKNEKVFLTTFGETYEGSTMMFGDVPAFKNQNKQREVDVVTIDSLLQNSLIQVPDIVKIDVQGFELEVLKGADCLFGKTELFIIEVSLFKFNDHTPEIAQIIKFMSAENYVIYDIPGYLRRPFDGALAQIDICFVKSDSFLKGTIDWDKR